MSFLLTLKNRVEQVAEAAVDIAENNKVDQETHDIRLSICMKCEFLFKSTRSCKKCGCFVNSKTWLPSQKCPIGKW